MKVVALRGVCIGVERHLKPGDTADLDAAQAQFLKSIRAVEDYVEPPAKPNTQTPEPAAAGKKEK
jgi:hypothetical protein